MPKLYYAKQNIYVNTNNNVLFDLNKLEIYEMDKATLKIFKDLYFNEDIVINSKEVSEVFEVFFNNSNTEDSENKDIITSIRLNISNICNLKCSYCYANKGNYGKENNLMKPDLAHKICEHIDYYFPDVEEISFFGGEPLLNIEVLEIICNYFSSKSKKFSIVTNLTLLDDKVINLIKQYNITITGSLDGPKDINDINRVTLDNKGTFDTISKNIKQLNSKVPNALKMIEATYTNYSYKKYTKKQLSDYFYDNFKVSNIMFGDVITDNKELELPYKYNEYNIDTLNDDIHYLYDGLKNNKLTFLDRCAVPLLMLFTKKSNERFCNAGITSILIDDMGDIWPCQSYINRNEFKMGNILSFEASKDKAEFNNVKHRLKNIKKCNLEHCNECIAQYWCDKCIAYTSLTDSNQKMYYDKQKCYYNKLLTEKVLDQLSEYVISGEISLINENFKNLIEV